MTALCASACADDRAPGWVGGAVCAECHIEEARRWAGSDHDLAMQDANDATVLGNFSNTTFDHLGQQTTFFRRADAYMVRTEGPAGTQEEYEIANVFGVRPLQQYLIAFPGGRMQALGIAWDTRPTEEGGQRWFHLYPDEDIRSGDPLHWTGGNQNWNSMCAACHSTHLAKHYDATTDSYNTTWSEIDVSCEACHGPGSAHVDWVERGRTEDGSDRAGLTVSLSPGAGDWQFLPGEPVARRSTEPAVNKQIETCAQCHSRRQGALDAFQPADGFLNAHRPALLEPDLYHPDGQILDEVYVYGSFLQSAMYRAGVLCSDCHDPHSQRVYDDGNALCTRCHDGASYDTPDHHNHAVETAGARCVECHMPEQTYMVVDPRRDHSLRVPRPDLTVSLGTPNACTRCHVERTPDWADEAIRIMYGTDREPHYGQALHAGRTGAPTAARGLAEIAADTSMAGIVRATALTLLGNYDGPLLGNLVRQTLGDPDPLVRFAAVRASEGLPPEERYATIFVVLDDTVRLVRDEIGRVLAPVQSDLVRDRHRASIDRNIAGYIASQLTNAERAESQLNVSVIYAAQGRLQAADTALQRAITIDSTLIAAYVNLSDLRRVEGRDPAGEQILRTALAIDPTDGAAHHALGLVLVRLGRTEEARTELAQAMALAPENPRYAYVYGVALHSSGRIDRAVEVLEEASQRHPYDLELVRTLLSIDQERGDIDAAIRHVRLALEIVPDDPGARELLARLLTSRAQR